VPHSYAAGAVLPSIPLACYAGETSGGAASFVALMAVSARIHCQCAHSRCRHARAQVVLGTSRWGQPRVFVTQNPFATADGSSSGRSERPSGSSTTGF
jgi:hypothetical protein